MYLAATGSQMLGSIGLGGAALLLVTALILTTKANARHRANQTVAMCLGIAAGMAFMGAGQVWDVPNDLVLTGLDAAGVGAANGPLGEVGMGAVSGLCVLIAWLSPLKPRTAGVLGIAMASIFTNAGGVWAMGSQAFADFIMGFLR